MKFSFKEICSWLKQHELITGIIIGCTLTIIGAFLQVQLQQYYEKEKNKEEMLLELVHDVNSVYRLGYNVTDASNSFVFPDRWESYINNGYIPWLINKNRHNHFISMKFPRLSSDFKKLGEEFDSVDSLLIKIRRRQPSIPPSTVKDSELNKHYNDAIKKYKQIDSLVQVISKEIYH